MSIWGDVRTQIRRELEEASAGIWEDVSLLQWANDAISAISASAGTQSDVQTTDWTAGIVSYDLPDGTIAITDARWNGVPLTRKDRGDLYDLTATGTPIYVYSDGSDASLWPIPDSDGTVEIRRICVPDLVYEDADEMPVAGTWDAAIRSYVKAKSYEQVGNFNMAGGFMQMYTTDLRNIVAASIKARNALSDGSLREVW